MSLLTLNIYIGIISAVLTLAIVYGWKKHKSWLMTFLQNFCGLLFIISGFVKAVDPMGTAFKMEDYFHQFEASFEGSLMSFIAPLFPFLSSFSIGFSVFMIVLEILIGVMLMIGARKKLTSWAFLLIIIFFTILTGFTFLTGFVPQSENFFNFSAWGAYDPLNMRVTDCGCFGDFIVLDPRISFFKDIVLLVPALYFVFKHKDMHQYFKNKSTNDLIALAVSAGLVLYCVSNYAWDIPHADFRPFKKGVNIREQKMLEEDALANISVLTWKLKNLETDEVVEINNEDYMANFAAYPKDKFEMVDRIMTAPGVKQTKISEFGVTGYDGYDIAEDILANPDPVFVLISYKIPTESESISEEEVPVAVLNIDTVLIGEDTLLVENRDTIMEMRTVKTYVWKKKYEESLKNTLVPFLDAAKEKGIGSMLIAGGADQDMLNVLKKDTGFSGDTFTADEILLKTIVRSNPGVLLLIDGQIVDKWHIRKLPEFQEVYAEHLAN